MERIGWAVVLFCLMIALVEVKAADLPNTATTASISATRTIETPQGIFKIAFSQNPANLYTNQQVEFEIDIREVVKNEQNRLVPLNDLEVIAEVKLLNGRLLASKLPTHSEGRTGTYGLHYIPTQTGEHQLNFTLSRAGGTRFNVEFPFNVVPAPINYLWYSSAGLWLLALVGWGGYRLQRIRSNATGVRLTPRLGMEFIILVVVTSGGLFLLYNLTKTFPLTTTTAKVVTATPLSTSTITISKESQLRFGIKTAAVEMKAMVSGLQVNGLVRVLPQAQAAISAPLTGLLRIKPALKIGDLVQKGEPLAKIEQILTVVDQVSLETYRLEQRIRRTQALDQADHTRQQLVNANIELTRTRKLYELGAISLRELQEVEQRVQLATAEAAHAQQTLIDVNAQEEYKDPTSTIVLNAPFTGFVATINGVSGEQVEAGKGVITLVDLSSVWIEAQLFENDLSKVLNSKQASYRIPALGNEVRTAIAQDAPLLTVATNINPTTRSISAYFKVANPHNLMRDGMVAEISLDTSEGRELLTIPQQALVEDQTEKVVFIYKGGENFERRVVEVASVGLNEVAISKGLQAGERVVIEGLYQLRSSSGIK